MAAGMGMGLVYFAGVKVIGYTIASGVVKHAFQMSGQKKPNVLIAGLIRSGIGLSVGIPFGYAWFNGTIGLDWPQEYFFAALIPIRFAEWLFFFRWQFNRTPLQNRTMFAMLGGTVWSFLLDAIGIVSAFVIPSGAWIC